MVRRIGGWISVMTEWLGKQNWTAFCDSFRQQGAQAQEGTIQRKTAMEMFFFLTVLKLRVLLTFSVYISCLYSGFITAAYIA